MAQSAITLTVSGYRQLLTDMRKIEPGLNTEMRREIRKIGNPVRDAVKSGIPKTAKLSQMRGETKVAPSSVGRLVWGAGVQANKAVLDTRKPSRKAKNGTSLVKIRVSSPATVMADMAGRSGKYIGARPYAAGTKSNTYAYTTKSGEVIFGYKYQYRVDGKIVVGGRRHRNTGGQGRGMIRGLGGRGSRYVYPSVEKGLPVARYQISKVVDSYIAKVNRSKK
jgi:hypothetical protein